jgi:hypothetical protein
LGWRSGSVVSVRPEFKSQYCPLPTTTEQRKYSIIHQNSTAVSDNTFQVFGENFKILESSIAFESKQNVTQILNFGLVVWFK